MYVEQSGKVSQRMLKDLENRKKYVALLADNINYEVAIITDCNVSCVTQNEFIAYYDLNRVKFNGEVSGSFKTQSSKHKSTERALESLREDFGKIFSDFNPNNGHPLTKVGCTVIVETDSKGKIVEISEPKKFFATHKFDERE